MYKQKLIIKYTRSLMKKWSANIYFIVGRHLHIANKLNAIESVKEVNTLFLKFISYEYKYKVNKK